MIATCMFLKILEGTLHGWPPMVASLDQRHERYTALTVTFNQSDVESS